MTEQVARDYEGELDQLIREAIAAISEGAQMATRWILVYEVANVHGRIPMTTQSNGTTLADKAGLLRWAVIECDRAIAGVLAIEDEDEP